MSDDHSDGEGSGGREADPVDTTKDMEIEMNLPLEVDEEQDRPRVEIQKPPTSSDTGWSGFTKPTQTGDTYVK